MLINEEEKRERKSVVIRKAIQKLTLKVQREKKEPELHPRQLSNFKYEQIRIHTALHKSTNRCLKNNSPSQNHHR